MKTNEIKDPGKITVDSYEGNEPFLFVSYSHVDTAAVNRVLVHVDREKYRVWYDDTMEIGEDFREELRERIEACCAVLLFISDASMNSKYCGMEIITAYKYGKRIYPVYLSEEVEIPAPLKMILDNLQHVKSDRIDNEKYLAKLVASLPIEAMRALDIRDGVLVRCKDGSPTIKIPAGVTEIGPSAFKNCEKLESIDLGTEVRVISSEAFRGCKRLTEIYLPRNIRQVGESAFRDCISMTKLVVENDEIEIGERAFENCATLSDLQLPRAMAEIYGGVFNSCKSLENLVLPEELTVLGENALGDCVKIRHIDIPASVSKIDDLVFNGCVGLESIKLNDRITKIGKNAFKECTSLHEIRIPASVVSIGIGPFRGCSRLSAIDVDSKSKNYKSVEHILFNKSKSHLICFPAMLDRTKYDIPDSVTVINDWAFCACERLTAITIPDSVYEIGEGAFYKCVSLEEVVLPDSVLRIDDVAFRGCYKLRKLVIPDSVKEFGWGVLNGCENVTVICSDHSVAANYCDRKNIPHRSKI